MSSKIPNAREHGVWPPAPEVEPAEDIDEPISLSKFLSRLCTFTAALSIGCVVYDFVVSWICKDDGNYYLHLIFNGYMLTSGYVQLVISAVSAACGAGSRTVTVSRFDNAIRICAIVLTCLCVFLIFTILTEPREK
jgi:hypothetical protein